MTGGIALATEAIFGQDAVFVMDADGQIAMNNTDMEYGSWTVLADNNTNPNELTNLNVGFGFFQFFNNQFWVWVNNSNPGRWFKYTNDGVPDGMGWVEQSPTLENNPGSFDNQAIRPTRYQDYNWVDEPWAFFGYLGTTTNQNWVFYDTNAV